VRRGATASLAEANNPPPPVIPREVVDDTDGALISGSSYLDAKEEGREGFVLLWMPINAEAGLALLAIAATRMKRIAGERGGCFIVS
jgi:hypothetical protein